MVLLDEGESEYRRAEEIEEELKGRRIASCGCEKVFHSLVELANAVIAKHGMAVPETHDERWEALHEIGRDDLTSLYSEAKDALHTSCYYGQRMGPRQRIVVEQVRRKIEEESKLF